MSVIHDHLMPVAPSGAPARLPRPEARAPDERDRADLHETHTSYVIAIGDTVHKMKKPVRTAFLDFSTRAARWEACTREVALNRRFAPDVYRGVAELTGPEGGLGEPLVVMRRLPSARRLSTLAETGTDVADDVGRIAAVIAAVHAKGPFGESIDAHGTRSALETRWRHNIDEIRASEFDILPSCVVDTIESRVRRYLAGRAALFDTRLRHKRIVDGHGDLLADDIFCLEDGPRIIDCLDFDDALRHLDGIDDICCLAMDLLFHGRGDLADDLLATYRAAARDDAPTSLVHHYIAYRAFMRAKVDCIAAAQGDPTAADDARAHADLAAEHLLTGAVGMAVVGGLPGTGKSTLAAALAGRIDAVVISSDVVRKELAGIDPTTACSAPVNAGLYTASSTAHTYAEMFRRARRALATGVSVVLDASFTDPRQRDRASMIAECTHSHVVHLECRAPEDVALDRITRRRGDPSDADAGVYHSMSARQHHRAADMTTAVAALDTTRPRAQYVDEAHRHWIAACDPAKPRNSSAG